MAVAIIGKELKFPPTGNADEDGLLAIGGDLSIERLLLAYRNGIFPWYNNDEPVCWWCPDPRFVLFPGEIKVSNSMRTILNNGSFKFTIDRAFGEVIQNCRVSERKGQEGGTWITGEMQDAYNELHEKGYAHSAEAWKDGELVGGVYGVQLGKVFFGESMFSKHSNTSKFAFIKFVSHLQKTGVELIDCQVYTAHLESLGARMISRNDFLKLHSELVR